MGIFDSLLNIKFSNKKEERSFKPCEFCNSRGTIKRKICPTCNGYGKILK